MNIVESDRCLKEWLLRERTGQPHKSTSSNNYKQGVEAVRRRQERQRRLWRVVFKSCVWQRAAGGGECTTEEQEPHAKMWGITSTKITQHVYIWCPWRSACFNILTCSRYLKCQLRLCGSSEDQDWNAGNWNWNRVDLKRTVFGVELRCWETESHLKCLNAIAWKVFWRWILKQIKLSIDLQFRPGIRDKLSRTI